MIDESDDSLLNFVSISGKRRFGTVELEDLVLNSFLSIASPPTHLITNVQTDMGFSCLAQGVFDTNTQVPLKISDVGGEKLNDIPTDAQK